MTYLMLTVAIVAEVLATTAMKESSGFTRLPWSVATIVGYAVAFYFLSLTLKTLPTGLVYATWSGVGIILISLVAWLFHGQKLDIAAIVGISLIICGVIVLNVFSRTSSH